MRDSLLLQSNPQRNYLAYKQEIDQAIEKVLNSGIYVMGHEVRSLETEFSSLIGTNFSVGVSNGTDAITMCLKTLGIKKGDEVVTTSHTATATIAGILASGALPVLVDIDSDTYNMDVDSLEKAISRKTKAVVAVHLYGNPCNVSAIKTLCDKRGIFLIEDASQAHGATHNGAMVGSIGHMGVFSCYPTKNLGALGDAGLITTNNSQYAESLAIMRQYGWTQRNYAIRVGGNYRLDELQAAVLRVKLRYLAKMNERRREISKSYIAYLSQYEIKLPLQDSNSNHVFHQFVISTIKRDELQMYLEKQKVQTNIHYPYPVHDQPGYKDKVKTVGNLRNTNRVSELILSLPMYPELTDEEVSKIKLAIGDFFERNE